MEQLLTPQGLAWQGLTIPFIYLYTAGAWLLIGLAIYLATASAVTRLCDDWCRSIGWFGRLFICFGYMLLGPLALLKMTKNIGRASRLKKKKGQEEAERQESAKRAQARKREEIELRLIFGPNETDDWQSCCELKKAVQRALYDSEQELEKIKLQPNPDKYILEYMPQLEHTPSPATVREKQIEARLAKLKESLTLTQNRIDRLAEESRRLREQKRLDDQKAAELKAVRDREEREAAAKRREQEAEIKRREQEQKGHLRQAKAAEERRLKEQEEAAAAEKARMRAQAMIMTEKRVRREMGMESEMAKLTLEVADRLWTHESKMLEVNFPDRRRGWLKTPIGLVNSLDTDMYGHGFIDHRSRIVSWFRKEYGDERLASQLAGCDNFREAQALVKNRLEQALKYREYFQEELLKLQHPELAELERQAEDAGHRKSVPDNEPETADGVRPDQNGSPPKPATAVQPLPE